MTSLPTSERSESLSRAFDDVSIDRPARPKRKPTPPPFSLRLSAEERQRLEEDAGAMTLGAYIRSRLFDGPPPRRSPGRHPVKDHQLLARLLGELGQSRVANNLNQLAKAANSGSLLLTPDGEATLRAACDAVRAIRRDLMTALGLDAGETS